jgi:hypothetical protein
LTGWAASAWAQAAIPNTLSALSGRVVDPLHLPVPGLSIALEDLGLKRTRILRTDAEGRFEARDLPAGDYEFDLSVPGFEAVREPLLIAGPLVEREVVLEVGRLSETVTIAGPSPRAPVRREQAAEVCLPQVDALTQSPIGGALLPPRMLSRTTPAFPEHLNDAQVEGEVRFEGRIGVDGALSELSLVAATHPEFAAAAETALRDWRWESPLLNCVPIEVRLTVAFRFTRTP